jgi:hypothetical protein
VFAACFSAKGGSGTTVVAAALAVVLARRDRDGALLVDLAGDAPAALGLPEPSGPGLTDWLAAGAGVPADGLARLELDAGGGLRLLARGAGALDSPARLEVLAGLLAAEARSVVVDCGVVGSGDDPDRVGPVVAAADERLLVTRPCYLSLRRAAVVGLRPTGVVLVSEPGRALGTRDVEQVVGAPVVAEVPVDPAVARAVDAGLLASRLPRVLERALGRAS